MYVFSESMKDCQRSLLQRVLSFLPLKILNTLIWIDYFFKLWPEEQCLSNGVVIAYLNELQVLNS